MKSSKPSPVTEPLLDETDEEGTAEALSEGQLYDFITNQPVQDSPVERTLQTVARSLVDEYGFDHTQLARDQSLAYELIDGDGKARKVAPTRERCRLPGGHPQDRRLADHPCLSRAAADDQGQRSQARC